MRKIRKAAKRVLSIVLAITMAFFGLPGWVSPERTAHADGEVTYEKGATMQDAVDLTDQFGVIVFDTLIMHGHQHANIMTGNYIGGWYVNGQLIDLKNTSECAVRNDYRTDSESMDNYVQTIVNSGPQYEAKFGLKQDRLIVGSGHNVNQINRDQWSVDGATVDASGTVLKESDEWKYVDLEQLQRSYAQYSSYLASMESTEGTENGVHTNFTNIPEGTNPGSYMNNLRIDVPRTDDGMEVLNVTAADLVYWSDHNVRIVFPQNSQASLLINIDMAGKSSLTIDTTLLSLDGDNTTYGNSHPEYENDHKSYEKAYADRNNLNRVYFNFYDSSASDKQYHGRITTTVF